MRPSRYVMPFPQVAPAGWGDRQTLRLALGRRARPVRLLVEPFCAHFWTFTHIRFGQEERLCEGTELAALCLTSSDLPTLAADVLEPGAELVVEAFCHSPYLAGLGWQPRTWWWFARFWCSRLAWRLLFTRRPPTLACTLVCEVAP